MGSCLSGFAPPHLIDVVDGNEEDYQHRYLEERVLGEGEFGVVKLIHDMQLKKQQLQQQQQQQQIEEPTPFACKILQKGVVFKDNVLYTPLKPEVLQGEVQMLRTLAGKNYCLQLLAVYESTKRLYVITECCMGGTMTQYVAASSGTSFTTQDVSRIAYQLLLAVNHCAKYQILHRDIKPDNIMFTHSRPGADIRLIDFGSGCMDSTTNTSSTVNSNTTDGIAPSSTSSNKKEECEYNNGLRVHATFAGSAFYISPELYNRSYTAMTDIWSVGVTLYVLVAGYPADALQKTFNILQSDKRDLHTLPNIPSNDILPESFFTLLNGCLTYWYDRRPNAKQLLKYEFVQLHQQQPQKPQQDVNDAITAAATTATELEAAKTSAEIVPSLDITTGTNGNSRPHHSLRGSVLRHNIFLNFQQYERSLTALLATLLSKSELEQLVFVLDKRVMVRIGNNMDELSRPSLSTFEPSGIKEQQQLAVVPISELKSILCDDLLKEGMYVSLLLPSFIVNDVFFPVLHSDLDIVVIFYHRLDQIDKLSVAKNQYDNFAYHTALLNDFVRNKTSTTEGGLTSSAHFVRGRNGFGGSIHQMTGSNASSVNSSSSARRGSIGNKNVFKTKSKKKTSATDTTTTSSMKRSVSTGAFLN